MPTTNVLIGVGLAALVALVVVLVVLFSGGGSDAGNVTTADVAKARAAVRAAGGTFVARRADAAQEHMSDPNQHVTYETFPAASGIHNPTTSIWGNYRTSGGPAPGGPQPRARRRRHLVRPRHLRRRSRRARRVLRRRRERSHHHADPRPVSGRDVSEARQARQQDRAQRVDRARGRLRRGTVYIATLPKFDAKAFAAFRDTFRGKGPERFPVSQMLPGGN